MTWRRWRRRIAGDGIAPAYRTSARSATTKQILRSRRLLVQMRTGAVSLLRSLLRQSGYRLGTGSCETVPARVARLALPVELAETVAPLQPSDRRVVDRDPRARRAPADPHGE